MKEYQNNIENIKNQISEDLEELIDVIKIENMTAELIEQEIDFIVKYIKNNRLKKLKEIEEEGYELTSEEAFDLKYDILEAEMMGN